MEKRGSGSKCQVTGCHLDSVEPVTRNLKLLTCTLSLLRHLFKRFDPFFNGRMGGKEIAQPPAGTTEGIGKVEVRRGV